MHNLKTLIHNVLLEGESRGDRTGTGTTSVFGTRLEWDLSKGFPATTCKRLAWKSVVSELLWFLRGSTNVHELREILHGPDTYKFTIWDANYENQGKALGYSGGELGPVYGKQFHHENQLGKFIEGIKTDPTSRRHLITLWNPSDIKDMALPPCHGIVIQANVGKNGTLDMQWYQRSVDSFLGLPFNIASYALFTHIIAKLTNLKVGKLIFVGGDTHIYNNHVDQCAEYISRTPLALPTLVMPDFTNLSEVQNASVHSFKLEGYESHGTIKADMSI
jgi:thymidylate synthase|tara:strand:- start:3760 stop:4587 length:828 start_codon:yes stop_codon:yes gene_type:complete